jgi:hypothetical protein
MPGAIVFIMGLMVESTTTSEPRFSPAGRKAGQLTTEDPYDAASITALRGKGSGARQQYATGPRTCEQISRP